MFKRKKYIKVIEFLIMFTMVLGISVFTGETTDAALIKKVEISFNVGARFKITNKEGETIIVDEEGKVSGTMNILKDELEMYIPTIRHSLTVRSSDLYVVEQDTENYNSIFFTCFDDGYNAVMIQTHDVCTAKIQFYPKGEISLNGNVQDYRIYAHMSKNSGSYDIDGMLYNPITLKDGENQMLLNGVSGKVYVEVESADEKYFKEGSYYFWGGESGLGYTNKGIYVNNAVKLNSKSSKELESVYVRPVNNDKEMLLTWTKVKKAKSYVIYKYDNAKKKFKEIAVQNGNDANYYVESIVNNEIYKYKVVARKKKNGKGKKIGGKGYEVSAVPGTNEKANVTAVKIKGLKKIVIKKNSVKKLKLNGKCPMIQYNKKKYDVVLINTHSSKKLLSESVRWFSSDKKILRINPKTGKIKVLKKGKCTIWAKAHNGVNSKHIKIVVG